MILIKLDQWLRNRVAVVIPKGKSQLIMRDKTLEGSSRVNRHLLNYVIIDVNYGSSDSFNYVFILVVVEVQVHSVMHIEIGKIDRSDFSEGAWMDESLEALNRKE